MWNKLIELSQLEIFSRNDYGDVLFTIALIALVFGVIIFFRIIVWGVVKLLLSLFNTVKEAKIALKAEETRQIEAKKRH